MKNEAIRPHTSSGCSSKSSGPGRMPFMRNAPSSTAVVAPPGMPRVSVGTKLAFAAALLAASGAATPSIAPLPNSALFFDTFFSMP